MVSPYLRLGWSRLVTPFAVFCLVACPPPEEDDTGDSAEPGAWFVERQDLPGAALSLWGTDSSDLWVALASEGPSKALRWDGETWTDLAPPSAGDLWWVSGPDDEHVWFAGEAGTLLRYERTGGTFTTLDTPTGATLYGVWGADGGPTYAVGGDFGADEWPVVVRVTGDEAVLVNDLPTSIVQGEVFFKVWGTGSGDVWIIGDQGSVLHFDGFDWSRQVLPGSPRLVTVNGNAAGELLAVGGQGTGVIFSRDADSGVWTDVSPSGSAPLNGVYVTESGQASVAGLLSKVMVRESGTWATLPPPPLLLDWHAVWIDERGHTWVAGGDLIDLNDGALLRFDPQALPEASE